MWVQADEEGDNMDFESLMSQLFEVLITLVGKQRYKPLMPPIVPVLVYLTIGKSSYLDTYQTTREDQIQDAWVEADRIATA